MKKLILRNLPVVDLLLLPFVYPAAWLLKIVRILGVHRLLYCRNALMEIGVFPIRDHYYEPQFDYRKPKQPLSMDRSLPGIEWNISEQLELLATFSFSHELAQIPHEKTDALEFYLDNPAFAPGDAGYWYQLIRLIKPRRIFEVGSGYSTLMAIKAICRNHEEDPNYDCKHVCIEPFSAP
jgi:hypothetical protein